MCITKMAKIAGETVFHWDASSTDDKYILPSCSMQFYPLKCAERGRMMHCILYQVFIY